MAQTSTNADIVDLRDFYATRLGTAAARSIAAALQSLWRPISQERLVGLGYALPYLDALRADAERTFALMPASQGAVRWPPDGRSATALVEGDALPLGDAAVDRILLVHALEFAEDPHLLLREIWRVLAPGGQVVIVVPNRRGIWAQFDHTPFGTGRPWSRGQASRLLRDAMFTTAGVRDALLFPPLQRDSHLALVPPFEWAGRRFWPMFGGAIVIGATKTVSLGLAVTRNERARLRALRPVLVPQGAATTRAGAGQKPIVSSKASQDRDIW